VYGGEQPAPTVEDIWRDPEAANIMEEFRLFFEDASVQKVWHNYGFDRHVMERLGFRMQGFGGDTLHMARLWDASRKGTETYALDSLSKDNKV
jgi:DNA polymerase I-like protein with 3'-5' exonuclease and polymerase domains